MSYRDHLIYKKHLRARFIKKYRRIEEVHKGIFKIKGCNDCIYKKLAIRKQDFPCWLGELQLKDLVVIGLEAF